MNLQPTHLPAAARGVRLDVGRDIATCFWRQCLTQVQLHLVAIFGPLKSGVVDEPDTGSNERRPQTLHPLLRIF